MNRTRIPNQRGRHFLSGRLSERGDDGNLVAVLVLTVVLALLIAITVAALVPTFKVASTSQNGEQAVAQANAGVSDALYRLDQEGDNVTSFCVGQPPASLLSGTSLSASSCLAASATPLSNAPGFEYYVAARQSGPFPSGSGITDEVLITATALVSGETRTVTTLVYRVADSFALFGVSGFDAHGALKQATVYEVGGYPETNPIVGGTVSVGVGVNGGTDCTGNSQGTQIITVGQQGAQITNCPTPTLESTKFEPALPSVCGSGQLSTAFAPCINTSNYAMSGGQYYCPLYGTGIPNTLNTATALATPPPVSGAVFNCATGASTAVTIGSSSAGCPSTSPLPFGLSTIPPGSYYFDSANVTVQNIDPCMFSGAVNVFDLPTACQNNPQCLYQPTSSTNSVFSGTKCSAPPNGQSVSLTESGYINAGSTSSGGTDFTPGNPSNFNLYWNGNTAVSLSGKPVIFDGNIYAPGAVETIDGSAHGAETYGSMVFNCVGTNGSPQLYLVYPEHPSSFLQGWTQSHYSISP